MGNESVLLIIIVCCVIMSAYFSATETSFLSLNRIRIKNMASKGNKRAELVTQLCENYDSLLSTILVGNNIVNILSASLSTLIFVKFLGDEAGASISTVVTTIVVLIFGEVSPKSIAKESPEAFAMFSAPIIHTLMVILTPINFFFKQWKKLLSKIFHSAEDSGITEEEILTMVEEAEQDGSIDKEESSLIRNAIEFNDMDAMDICTPRVDVVGIPTDATKEEAAQLFKESGYSRLPVYEESLDQIVGILYQKDFYNKVYHNGCEITEVLRPVYFTTKNKKIDSLLKELQQKKMHIAVIVDEFGGTIGIVTMEDIIEEIVGEIWDEHDVIERDIVELSESEYMLSGKASIEKVFEMLGREEDEEMDVLTVSGWVMEQLGRIPVVGDSFDCENMHVEVVEMKEKRIEKVHLAIVNKVEEAEASEAS
ncbi:MAG: hemolysin family protein [bacterium]|nr:hemolysin family protein [bacterium]